MKNIIIAKSQEDINLINLLKYDEIKAGKEINNAAMGGDKGNYEDYERYVHKMRSMLDFFDIKYKYKTDWGDCEDNYSWYIAKLPGMEDSLFFIEIISDYDIKCIEIDEIKMFGNMCKYKTDNTVKGDYILQHTHTLDGSM